jgi:hypothetical protein
MSKKTFKLSSDELQQLVTPTEDTKEATARLFSIRTPDGEQLARAITADAASEIELAVNDLRDLEGLLIVMQQAYLGGEPDPEATAQALNSVNTSLMKIRESLDAVLDQIYGRKE